MDVKHPRNPPRDYDPGNGKGYWGYGPTDRERHIWVPPRPSEFPGDEASWYAYVMWRVPPRLTSGPAPTHKQAYGETFSSGAYGLLWGLAAFLFTQVGFAVLHEDITMGFRLLISLMFGVLFGLVMPLGRRRPLLTACIGVAAVLFDHFHYGKKFAKSSGPITTPPQDPGTQDYTSPAGFGF